MEKFKIPKVDDEKSIIKTVRIKNKLLSQVEKLANENNISVNRLINECIEFALNNLSEEDIKDTKK